MVERVVLAAYFTDKLRHWQGRADTALKQGGDSGLEFLDLRFYKAKIGI